MIRPLLFVALVLTALSSRADAVPPGTDAQIRERLAPIGKLCRAGDTCGAPAVAATGTGLSADQIYGQFCVACHAAGVSGAPKLGAVADWQPRISKGLEMLAQHTIAGLPPAMPPRGTCMNCTDDELRATMQYMVDSVK